jgi:hypothetical protein
MNSGTHTAQPEAHPSARVRANRLNAARSTGPSTSAGRAKASLNATRHGLLSKPGLLADESLAEFAKFERGIRKAMSPVGGLEAALAVRFIAAAWRLRRFERIETLMLETGRKNWRGDDAGVGNGFVGTCVNGDSFTKLSRYEAGIERAMFRALHELQRVQAERRGREVALPSVMDVDVTVCEENVAAPTPAS